ncbi:MAG: SH3 domain-containing protein [Burkholderiaceae bacterium]|nr:SH3 domain-containing protein [Rhodoferax sp.]MCW5630513.1 SH3 domain-containing protein [Rhodoferax sp.]MCW5645245.1 SH3 domain-containing protein [Rhodoferax sp.]
MGTPTSHYARAIASCLLISQAILAHADTVTVKRDTQLRESPSAAAAELAALPAQTPLTRLETRRGPWIEVRTTTGQTGWVHLFDVGTTPAASGGNFATGALRGLTSLFGGGNSLAPTKPMQTATIGIRGLGAEEIANAQPNLTAVTLMETLHMSAAQAQQFGAVAGLAPMAIEPLPVPPMPAQPATPGSTGTGGGNR